VSPSNRRYDFDPHVVIIVELLDDGGSWQGIYRLEYCVSYIAAGMEQIDRVEAHPHHQEQPTRKREEEKNIPRTQIAQDMVIPRKCALTRLFLPSSL